MLYNEQGAVAGIATGDVGIAKDGSLKVAHGKRAAFDAVEMRRPAID